MLVAPIRKVDQEAGVWVPVCAKTGIPTTVTMDLPVVKRPTWPWFLLPFGVVAVIVARACSKETSVVRVAIAPEAWERHRHRTWTVVALTLCAAVLSIGLLAAPTAALAVIIAGLVSQAVRSRSDWLTVSEGHDDFFVSGVHPAFLAATLSRHQVEVAV